MVNYKSNRAKGSNVYSVNFVVEESEMVLLVISFNLV